MRARRFLLSITSLLFTLSLWFFMFAKPAHADSCVAIAGDSVEAGNITYDAGNYRDYPPVFSGQTIASLVTGGKNFAVPADTLSTYLNSSTYQSFLNSGCQNFVVGPWVNDMGKNKTPGPTISGIQQIVSDIQTKNPTATIFVVNYYTPHNYPPYAKLIWPMLDSTPESALNSQIQSIKNISVINISGFGSADLESTCEVSTCLGKPSDGVHLSAQGRAALSDAITAAVTGAGNSSGGTSNGGSSSSGGSSQNGSGGLSSGGSATIPSSGPGVNGDKIGPELAFADQKGQQGVNDKVIQPNSFSGTVQVLNSIEDPTSPYNPSPGAHVFLRVYGIHGSIVDTTAGCNDPGAQYTTPDAARAFADKLNNSSAFPPGTLVIFGNELNNLEKEYCYSHNKGNTSVVRQAALDYASTFKAFAAELHHGPGQKYVLAPTSLDPNNNEYSAYVFATTLKSAGVYDMVDGLAQSVFDVPPASDLDSLITSDMVNQIPNHNRNLATYLAIQQIAGKPVIHFNGWGSQPDLSLRQQLNWLLTTQLPSGINSAATLIVNNCNGQHGNQTNSWFYFIQGKIFDADGNQIDPDTCSKTQGLGSSLYIYPGIEDQNTPEDQLSMASHYMITCAPRFGYVADIKNLDKVGNTSDPNFIPTLFSCAKGACFVGGASGTAFINHEQTTIPLFRFQNASAPDTSRLNDLESFFSNASLPNKDVSSAQDSINNFVASGNDSKSLALAPRCSNTLSFLHAIKTLCDNQPKSTTLINNTPDQITPPTTTNASQRCPLDLDVPGAGKSYLDVLSSAPPDFSCFNINASQASQAYAQLLSQVETTTPKAFKPAYIIHYTDYPYQNNTHIDRLASWFAPDGGSNLDKAKNRVKVTKVYVPANVASTSDDESAFTTVPGTGFNSGFMNTMLSQTSLETQNRIADDRKAQVSQVMQISRSEPLAIDPDPIGEKHVDCPECNSDQFLTTIVKRINAEIDRPHAPNEDDSTCMSSDLVGEKAQTIKTKINPDGNPDPVHEVAVGVKADLRGQEPNDHNLSTRTFMLLPEEYRNIADYGDVLAHTWLDPQYAGGVFPAGTTSKDTDVPGDGKSYKYLQLSDTAPKANGGLTVHMSSPQQPSTIVGFDRIAHSAVSLIGSINGEKIDTFDINPTVPGGRLTRALWEIVCHVLNPDPTKQTVPYAGFEKILQQGSSACYTTAPAPQCQPGQGSAATISQVGNGYEVTAPADASTLITSLPSEYGQKSCDWASGKGLAFALNANFGNSAHDPIGPFGFDGNITNVPPKPGTNPMSLMIDKNGTAHVYDWDGRSGNRADIKGTPDLTQAQFIVTGVYYDNFQPPYDGPLFRTAIGLKNNMLYIRTLAANPAGVKQAMADLGIDDGHFVMLDGDSVTQLCKANTDGTMTQVFPNPTDPNVQQAHYPFAVAVSMGIKAGSPSSSCSPAPGGNTNPGGSGDTSQTIACPGPKRIPIAANNVGCNANAPAPDASWLQLKQGVHYMVNQVVSISDPTSSGNQIDKCFNDVVDQSLAAGVNPIYTLTIWAQESGASNYARFPGVQDFGINSSSVVGFQAQLSSFLNLPYAYPPTFSQCFQNGCSWDNYSQAYHYGEFDSSCTITSGASAYAAKTMSNMSVVTQGHCDLPAYPTQMTSCH
ncbi:hypothetical protein C5B42_01810 [Candidatus Cerribacteria bacterium 'Amazon FNV 2010 28 9']|uniref:SGNH hydrolase-type esterase domain-containing protein n=1 Tax=Candidatus Cerribacteria bacterium 'Amazon FNV 2010 28 9' TaxID=2081795 RepID=A0A317JTD2_9BACT|nr:MAG: hypothetical protein C5B42_01810 [Candidatus Cerribacteria bacterium 'Amazon FNV 2010 28 9']